MAKKFGAVIVFREGVSREAAHEALQKLQALLDPATIYDRVTHRPRPDSSLGLKEFESDHGGPVWYLP